jgi:PPM family protein phosphatase
MFELRVTALTHCGNVKQRNEDCIGVQGFQSQSLHSGVLTMSIRSSELAMVAIADGLGGRPAGEMASRLVVDTLHQNLPMVLSEDIEKWIETADDRLRQSSAVDHELAGMASTVCVLVTKDLNAVLANVGDTPTYELRSGYLTKLTALDSGSHAPGESTNVVTQVLGGVADRTQKPLLCHQVDLSLQPGMVLLMCSDGLVDVVDRPTLERLLSGAPSAEVAVTAMLKCALALRADDNISIALIEVTDTLGRTGAEANPTEDSEPIQESAETDEVTTGRFRKSWLSSKSRKAQVDRTTLAEPKRSQRSKGR